MALKTVDDFLESVKITITAPSNQVLLTDSRILGFADEETMNELVPLIDSVNSEYLVIQENETTVANQQTYDIPYRAIGRKLRDLKITDGNYTRSLPWVPLEDDHLYNISGTPNCHNIKGDKIYIYPTPIDNSLTLQKFYLFRPARLIKTSDAGYVTGISGTTITLSSVPTGFVAGVCVDFIQGKSGYQTISYDKEINSVSGSQIVVSSAPASLAVGDYVAMCEQTPVIQFPDEFYSYLVLRTSKRCLEALGDFEGASVIENRLLQAKKNLQMLIEPRNEGASHKIINRNGLLRGNRRVRYFRGFVN